MTKEELTEFVIRFITDNHRLLDSDMRMEIIIQLRDVLNLMSFAARKPRAFKKLEEASAPIVRTEIKKTMDWLDPVVEALVRDWKPAFAGLFTLKDAAMRSATFTEIVIQLMRRHMNEHLCKDDSTRQPNMKGAQHDTGRT